MPIAYCTVGVGEGINSEYESPLIVSKFHSTHGHCIYTQGVFIVHTYRVVVTEDNALPQRMQDPLSPRYLRYAGIRVSLVRKALLLGFVDTTK